MFDLVFFSDLKAIAENAKKLKQKEVIVAKRFESAKELLGLKQKARHKKIVFKFCHLLEKPEEKIDSGLEALADFFGCFGGNVSANKNAVSAKKIDFLFQAVGTQRLEFDSALANSARDNNVSVAVLFNDFLNASQRDLISLFRNYFLLAKICKSAGAQMVVFSGARKPEEMRSALDLESFLSFLMQPKNHIAGD